MKDKAKTKERPVRVKRKPNIVEALSAVIVLLVIFSSVPLQTCLRQR